MIATITVRHTQEISRSDPHHSRDSNLAGAPLPIIPRRTTRSQSLPTSQSLTQRPFFSTSYHQWDQNVIESDEGSSSGSEACKSTTRARAKRVRGVRHGIHSPAVAQSPQKPSIDSVGQIYHPKSGSVLCHDCPEEKPPIIAAPRPLVYTPGMLRLSLETMRSHMLTNPQPLPYDPRSVPGNGSKSAPPPGSEICERSRLIVRKKSGQPVKSSLKASRSTQGKLSVITGGSPTKSEPPTPKAVHFDAQLEHVKLFLAEQKPLAVSRDGSPTEDTSGTDSDFPSFIFGDDDDTRHARKKLVMRPINMDSKPGSNANVVLEDFYLNFDGSKILGKVRVRNIAFAKTIVVRFTFDSWQTTSEVTAGYAESINPQFDRFSFSIRLNDLLARIEGKTLMMAVRYNVEGHEYWDNNHHRDYVATFTKAKVVAENKTSDDKGIGSMENLKSRLEQVATQEKDILDHPFCPPGPTTLQLAEIEPPSLKSGVALGSRYDFATSLRNSNAWRPTDVSGASPPRDTRSLSPPKRRSRTATIPAPPSSIPWPEKKSPSERRMTLPGSLFSLQRQSTLGLPRDFDGCSFVTPTNTSIQDDATDDVLSSRPTRGRNHQRGFTDTSAVGANSAVRRTPPGSPKLDPLPLSPLPPMFSIPLSTPRYHSFPPLMAGSVSSAASPDTVGLSYTGKPVEAAPHDFLGIGLGDSSGDSELSTSSLSTPTSSPSATPSPTVIFKKPALPLLSDDRLNIGTSFGPIRAVPPVSPGTCYRHFLDKFCFFTGASVNVVEGAPNTEKTLTGDSAQSGLFSTVEVTPSESVDDLVAICGTSGAPRPTIATRKWGSRAATPELV